MKQTLDFASHPANLSMVRDFVRKFLSSIPFTDLEIDLMILGIDEACTNIIRYAYHHAHTEPITLTCERNDRCVTFRLRDFGTQCDPAKLRARPLEEVKPGGLGLHLIKRAFNEIDYVLKDKGTELVLTRFLQPAESK
jgi:anti-sigma regulatory factor (Ser/Thr protein kinase)